MAQRASVPGTAPTSEARATYAHALTALLGRVPFLVGGGFALEHFLGVPRATKDLDVFVRPGDLPDALRALAEAGFEAELLDPRWIAKAYAGDLYVDIVFATRNGVLEVDDGAFVGAVPAVLLGHAVLLQPIEEMIASKVFVIARDRFDVADVCHLLLLHHARLDWRRLLDRLAHHAQLLRIHVELFHYIYPGRRDVVPEWVLCELGERVRSQERTSFPETAFRGLLLDPETFAVDIDWGYEPVPTARS